MPADSFDGPAFFKKWTRFTPACSGCSWTVSVLISKMRVTFETETGVKVIIDSKSKSERSLLALDATVENLLRPYLKEKQT